MAASVSSKEVFCVLKENNPCALAWFHIISRTLLDECVSAVSRKKLYVSLGYPSDVLIANLANNKNSSFHPCLSFIVSSPIFCC